MLFNKKAMDLATGLRPEKKLQLFNKGGKSEIYIYDVIGESFGGIGPKQVIDVLKGAQGNSLDIHILSEGGDVFAAKGIYNALVQFKGKKTCYVDGLAASAATFVMCAGDQILAAPGSTFMTHGVWTATIGNADDMRKMADQLEMETKNIASIYAKRCNKPVDEMVTWMADEQWFDCERAKELGFIDGEYETVAASATQPESRKISVKASPIEVMRMRAQSKR